jgi:hypothetical protein
MVFLIIVGERIDATKSHRTVGEIPIRLLQRLVYRICGGDTLGITGTNFIGGDTDQWAIFWKVKISRL